MSNALDSEKLFETFENFHRPVVHGVLGGH
jgi:hypothetical protein